MSTDRKKLRVIKAHSVEELEEALDSLYSEGLEVDCMTHSISPKDAWGYMPMETWTVLLTFKGMY